MATFSPSRIVAVFLFVALPILCVCNAVGLSLRFVQFGEVAWRRVLLLVVAAVGSTVACCASLGPVTDAVPEQDCG